jgi:hypothetical protein
MRDIPFVYGRRTREQCVFRTVAREIMNESAFLRATHPDPRWRGKKNLRGHPVDLTLTDLYMM